MILKQKFIPLRISFPNTQLLFGELVFEPLENLPKRKCIPPRNANLIASGSETSIIAVNAILPILNHAECAQHATAA